jgi:hypothetical protein
MLLFVASVLLAAAEPAAASATAPTPKPKRICRMEEAVTGSLTPKRVCVTVPQQAPVQAPKPAGDAAADKQPQAGSAGSGN